MEKSSNYQSGKQSSRYLVWLLQGQFDLKAAKDSLEDKNFEWSCYQAVQSVEKTLKSVIVHAGWRSPMTHKLGVLISMCNKANALFLNVKLNFRKLEAYTFISRYPFVFPGESKIAPHDLITKQDALVCVTIAEEIFYKVDAFLRLNKVEKSPEIDLEDYYYTEEQVKDRIRGIVQALKADSKLKLDKVVIFGTFAREAIKPRLSTMDILIVAETDLPFIERISYVRDLTKASEPIIEPLVYTPKEFEFMVKDEHESFLESALDEGRVVYDAKTLTGSSLVKPQ